MHDEPADPTAVPLLELTDPDGVTRWRFDTTFLRSAWTCIWGAGCQGIHDTARPELFDGCCSVGVELIDDEEAMTIAALGASLEPARFEHADHGTFVERRGEQWFTPIVNGACVFFNRPGFAGGVGCALHLAALDAGEDPLDWKPQTCTRMPLRVDERPTTDGTAVELTVRPWRRADWGPDGRTMAWWCTEVPEAYVGDGPVVERLAGELRVLLGDALYEQLADEVRRSSATG